jgi:hypothetical protein
MKFLQVAILAIVLVASAHALSCNVATATPGTCPGVDLGADIDTCFKCVAAGVASANGCSSTGAGSSTSCSGVKSICETTGKGTYTSCQTANCNGCSPASALQISAFLLLAALSAMFL